MRSRRRSASTASTHRGPTTRSCGSSCGPRLSPILRLTSQVLGGCGESAHTTAPPRSPSSLLVSAAARCSHRRRVSHAPLRREPHPNRSASRPPPSPFLAWAIAPRASSLRTILVFSRHGLVSSDGKAVGDHEMLEFAVAARDGPLDFGLGRVVGDWRPVAHEPAVGRGTGHQDVRGLHELEVVIAEVV